MHILFCYARKNPNVGYKQVVEMVVLMCFTDVASFWTDRSRDKN